MGEGKSNNLSAFGKPKWRSYRRGGQEVPADLGGMSVFINEAKFEHFKEVCEAAQLGKPSDGHQAGGPQESEMKFFRELLQSPITEAGHIIEEHLDISQNDCDNDLPSKFDMGIGMYIPHGNPPDETAAKTATLEAATVEAKAVAQDDLVMTEKVSADEQCKATLL